MNTVSAANRQTSVGNSGNGNGSVFDSVENDSVETSSKEVSSADYRDSDRDTEVHILSPAVSVMSATISAQGENAEGDAQY